MRRFATSEAGRSRARVGGRILLMIALVSAATGIGLAAASVRTEPDHMLDLDRPTLVLGPGSRSTQVLGLTIEAALPLPAGWTAYSTLLWVRDDLGGRSADKKDQKRVDDAENDLDRALDGALWPAGGDGNHVDPKDGGKVFDAAKKAVADLGAVKDPPGWVATDVDDVVAAARLLATNAIADNACSPVKAKELAAARDELAKGDQEYAKPDYDGATGHFKHAWQHAQRAQGTAACAAFTLTPDGAVFSESGMVPGDEVTAPVAVQVVDTGGTVTLSTSVTTGAALAGQLQLTVHDDTMGEDIHTGSLASFGSQAVCGAAAASPPCLQWAEGEVHDFTFTVSFPRGSGNQFQGTGTTAQFVWTRS